METEPKHVNGVIKKSHLRVITPQVTVLYQDMHGLIQAASWSSSSHYHIISSKKPILSCCAGSNHANLVSKI